MKSPLFFLKYFRMIGITEGISYLLLLGIAMPIKYGLNIPEPVKYVGWAHGVLFVAYVIFLLLVAFTGKRSFLWMVIAFIASLVPFGTFWLDKQLKKEEAEMMTV